MKMQTQRTDLWTRAGDRMERWMERGTHRSTQTSTDTHIIHNYAHLHWTHVYTRNIHTHTYTSTHIHSTCIHTHHTHRHVHTPTHTYTEHMYSHAIYSCTYVYTPRCIHWTCVLICMHTHTYTCIHIYTGTHISALMHTCMYTHAWTQRHIHSHMHHTQAYTHWLHTSTQIRVCTCVYTCTRMDTHTVLVLSQMDLGAPRTRGFWLLSSLLG